MGKRNYTEVIPRDLYITSFVVLSISWVEKHFKCNWSSSTKILWSYNRILMICRKKNIDKNNKNRFKSDLKIGILLAIMAGSATAMGASDLITSSAKHRMESI